jgi:hypothetical protein
MGGGYGGFQVPKPRTISAKLAVAFIALSLVAMLVPGLYGWIALVPQRVFGSFAVWQPLSYIFLASGPLDLVFGALIIFSIGGSLESAWGPRRLLGFAIGVTAVSGLLTLLLALAIPSLRAFPFPGGWSMTTALWVAYGLFIGRGQANFWGIPTTGNVLALIGIGFVVLGYLTGSGQAIPAAFAVLLTFAFMRGFAPKVLWLRFQSWRLQRQLRGRSKHLKVVGGKDANQPTSGSDRFLH